MEAKPRRVESYGAPNGTFPFDDWLSELKDPIGKAQIESRINRVRRGLIGDYNTIGDGIIELRFLNSGPGYRIYCVDDGERVLLLCAGKKGTQQADIAKARYYWQEYQS